MSEPGDDPGERRPASDRSFASAVKWSYAMDGGRQVLTTVVTFVLARALGPEVYGTAALALVFVLFVQLLQTQGIVAAIIQRRDLEARHLDSAFWGTLAVSVALTGTSVALAPWYASINDAPDLRAVVTVMSLMIPLQGLTLVQEAVVRRDMDFRSLAYRTNVSVFVGGVVAVIMAVAGAGVWSIVVQQVLTAAIGLVVLWGLSDWRPGWRFSWPALRDLLGFSVPSFAATLAVFANNRADALLIGVFFGPLAVGLYRFALRLVETVTDLTVKALQSASLPELSRFQHDRERFADRTLVIVRTSALVSLPLLGALAATADPIMALLGEDDWGPAADVLRILCIAGAVRAVTLVAGPMMQALGRPGLLAAVSWLSAAFSVGAMVAAGFLLRDADETAQVVGVAVSRAAVAVAVILLLNLVVARALLGISPGGWARAAWPGAAAAAVAVLVGSLVAVPAAELPALVAVPLVGGSAVVAAAAVLWVAAPESRRIAGRMARRRSSATGPDDGAMIPTGGGGR